MLSGALSLLTHRCGRDTFSGTCSIVSEAPASGLAHWWGRINPDSAGKTPQYSLMASTLSSSKSVSHDLVLPRPEFSSHRATVRPERPDPHSPGWPQSPSFSTCGCSVHTPRPPECRRRSQQAYPGRTLCSPLQHGFIHVIVLDVFPSLSLTLQTHRIQLHCQKPSLLHRVKGLAPISFGIQLNFICTSRCRFSSFTNCA